MIVYLSNSFKMKQFQILFILTFISFIESMILFGENCENYDSSHEGSHFECIKVYKFQMTSCYIPKPISSASGCIIDLQNGIYFNEIVSLVHQKIFTNLVIVWIAISLKLFLCIRGKSVHIQFPLPNYFQVCEEKAHCYWRNNRNYWF